MDNCDPPSCPVCGGDFLNLVDLGRMPLSVLGLETDPQKSCDGKCHQIRMFRCDSCGHVWNVGYDDRFSQTNNGGCTMYNSGGPWMEHMKQVAKYVCGRACGGRIVEVGAGNGEFARLCAGEDYVAYEPCDDADECAKHVPTYKKYFHAFRDLKIHNPSVILMRHVLEHFPAPRNFIKALRRQCREEGQCPDLIIEVPNIEPCLRAKRVEDWVYEHPQHFTPGSMGELARRNGWYVDRLDLMYNDEVILATLEPHIDTQVLCVEEDYDRVLASLGDVRDQLTAMHLERPGSVVMWGGAGKGATLINLLYDPTIAVVDSDKRKWGKCVPGTPTVIVEPAVLNILKPDLVLVTTSWRVKDIAEEIAREEYPVGSVAYIDRGKLTTYEG